MGWRQPTQTIEEVRDNNSKFSVLKNPFSYAHMRVLALSLYFRFTFFFVSCVEMHV